MAEEHNDTKPTAENAPALDGTPNVKTDVIAEDEPVYREGMDWFVLRVASNKESRSARRSCARCRSRT
jgi:hypothetical protein